MKRPVCCRVFQANRFNGQWIDCKVSDLKTSYCQCY